MYDGEIWGYNGIFISTNNEWVFPNGGWHQTGPAEIAFNGATSNQPVWHDRYMI